MANNSTLAYTTGWENERPRTLSRKLKAPRASAAYVRTLYSTDQLTQLRQQRAAAIAKRDGNDDAYWLGKYAQNGRNGRGPEEARITLNQDHTVTRLDVQIDVLTRKLTR